MLTAAVIPTHTAGRKRNAPQVTPPQGGVQAQVRCPAFPTHRPFSEQSSSVSQLLRCRTLLLLSSVFTGARRRDDNTGLSGCSAVLCPDPETDKEPRSLSQTSIGALCGGCRSADSRLHNATSSLHTRKRASSRRRRARQCSAAARSIRRPALFYCVGATGAMVASIMAMTSRRAAGNVIAAF